MSLYLSAPLPTIVLLHPSLLLVEAIIRSPNLSCWLISPSILSLAQPVKTEGPCVDPAGRPEMTFRWMLSLVRNRGHVLHCLKTCCTWVTGERNRRCEKSFAARGTFPCGSFLHLSLKTLRNNNVSLSLSFSHVDGLEGRGRRPIFFPAGGKKKKRCNCLTAAKP